MSTDAAVALCAAIRQLMDATVLTSADDDTLAAVTADVDALTEWLTGAGVREGMPWPDVKQMVRGHRPFSPVIGIVNPLAPPLVVRALEDRSVEGTVTMRTIHEGPPGAVHGGWVAALLDQMLGHANAAAGAHGMTGELTVRYRRPTPYGVPLVLRARTDSVDGRRVRCSGEIEADGVVTAEATALFIRPSAEQLSKAAEQFAHRRS